MSRSHMVLIAAGAALLWAPPLVVAAGGPLLPAAPTLAHGPDLLTAVLGIGLAVVAAVALVSALILRAARRRDVKPTKAGASEIVDRRARSRAGLRMPDDPIIAGMGLDPPEEPRARQP